MPELTADQAAEKLRGLGWKVFRWFNGSWKAKKAMGFVSGDSMVLSDAELIALAQKEGGEG